MKLRQGFVSNSSSSSFLIAIKDKEGCTCKKCGRADFTLDQIRDEVQSCKNGDSEWKCEGYEDVLAKVDPDDTELKKKMEVLKALGYDFAYFDISNHDCFLKQAINNSKNIEIVYQEY